MNYVRMTAAPVAEVLRVAEDVLTARLPIRKVGGNSHSVTLSGGDGTVQVSAHRHGLDTEVQVATDQLRTSRLDTESQYFLNELPYQPGDVPCQPGDAWPR